MERPVLLELIDHRGHQGKGITSFATESQFTKQKCFNEQKKLSIAERLNQ
jgi:hypothetical protein